MNIRREQLEADVVIVGGGPAGLSTAYHLGRLIHDHNRQAAEGRIAGSLLGKTIFLIEKGAAIGAHGFSGAVMDPDALRRMIPDFIERGAPVEAEVREEDVFYLTESGQTPFPIIPLPLRNRGNLIVSLSKLCQWLGEEAETQGVQIFPRFPGRELLTEDKKVVGVRTGEKGVDREGHPKSNFDPGIDILAKVTVIAEGPRGTLTRQWLETPGLEGKFPQVFELGVKEVFEMPPGRIPPGRVIHTLGYPLDRRTGGGGFVYTLGEDRIAVGMVVSLDSPDPLLNPHESLQRLKTHPLIRNLLRDGKPRYYGAKAISAGGYYTVPALYTSGALIVGESASLVNMARLKGIHTAIQSGMMAAETVFEAMIRRDYTETFLSGYRHRMENSDLWKELYGVRNFHQAMGSGGWKKFAHLGFQLLTGGRGIRDPLEIRPDPSRTEPIARYYPEGIEAEVRGTPKDGVYLLDKLTDVFNAGVVHEENQPPHLKIVEPEICISCWNEYRSPCTHFCPAQVYEMPPPEAAKDRRLRVSFTNCVHCKCCDIKCPHLNIRWTPPEGGGGPRYTVL